MNALDALNCPLSGVNLIEASAGTGKTWTIAALYTRLLLEADADGQVPGIDQVLVVTYTKAATAELRGRLRQRLHEMCAVLEGEASQDGFLTAMAERFPAGALRQQALTRLHAAIAGFDTAAIYTIHGFCQRALTDAAFESGQTFSAELVQDDSVRLQDAADDFWRRRVVDDPLLAQVLADGGETPEAWLAQIRPFLAKPYLQMRRPPETGLERARERVLHNWRVLCTQADMVGAALQKLQEASGLNARSYGPGHKAALQQQVARLLTTPDSLPALSRDERKLLDKLTLKSLAKSANKGAQAPEHPGFALIDDWLAAWDQYLAAVGLEVTRLKLDLIDWMAEEMARRRQAERQRSFDDLLTDLDSALSDPLRGGALARQLSSSFKVALIDEFQDTDPIQYHIFRACFVDQQRPVFLVGDPKQAIYSFRGADIFAYIDARQDASRQYTLDTNRRSSHQLVAAVNALFSRPDPFVLPEIHYQAVHSASQAERLEIADQRAPCVWQWLDFSATSKGASKQLAGTSAAEATADEIARLLTLALDGRASLVSEHARRPLCGGDIAVLVSTHRQGDLIRQALSRRNVPSVALTQESVFASREAQELLSLLSAWAEPGNESRLRRVLSTELFGWGAQQLKALQSQDSAWEALLAAHAEDHQRWLQQGFMAAWRHFFARQKLAERNLPLPDGERRLTNLSHLAELLQKESDSRNGLIPLLDWFQIQVGAQAGGEESLLRLESDASLVKIATIHSAKGLQYPIVFCPFLWDGALERRDTAFWRTHAEGGSWLTPDVLCDAGVKQAAQSELLAEKLRLAYVALTRAEHRQYIAWGWVQKMETAALSWLLHAGAGQALDDLQPLEHSQVLNELQDFVRREGEAVGLLQPQAEAILALQQRPAVTYQALAAPRAIYTPWRVTSFTGLAQHGAREHERPDHDRGVLQLPDSSPEPARAFPRGARAGTCLHAIMEQIDFMAPRSSIRARVDQCLSGAGFEPEYADAAFDLIERTLDVPLDPGLSLAQVPAGKRLIELEFMLPVSRLNAAALRLLLSDPVHGLDPLLRQAALHLEFNTVRGFFKGFVDLVCEMDGQYYLIDYKSNHLGEQAEDYQREALARSIAQEHYYLQYLLYCVAVRRYFTARGIDFDARFAGVRYLYMRGLDSSGNGVWSDKPSIQLLDGLDALFSE
jgi:exodeoxyribonuclease V beta subunit